MRSWLGAWQERRPEVRLQRYRKSLAMLEETIPGSRVVELLRFELEALEELPPATGEVFVKTTATVKKTAKLRGASRRSGAVAGGGRRRGE